MYIYIDLCMRICIYIYICTRVHTNTRIYNIYTYIHIYRRRVRWVRVFPHIQTFTRIPAGQGFRNMHRGLGNQIQLLNQSQVQVNIHGKFV